MKNLLIIYNVIFLLVGNVFFANIHYKHNLNHFHDHQNNECQECVNIENSNNYVADFQKVNFLNNNVNLFVYEYYSLIEFNIKQTYLSRAPPIS